MDPELIALIVTIVGSGAVANSVTSILQEYVKKRNKKKITISHDGTEVEVDLEKPDQARIYIEEFLARNQPPDHGGDK